MLSSQATAVVPGFMAGLFAVQGYVQLSGRQGWHYAGGACARTVASEAIHSFFAPLSALSLGPFRPCRLS